MGFKFEKQDLMSQDFLPAFVLLTQSETHLDKGWGGGVACSRGSGLGLRLGTPSALASPPPGLGGAGRRKSEWFISPPLCNWSNWAQDTLQGGPPCFPPLCLCLILWDKVKFLQWGWKGRQASSVK